MPGPGKPPVGAVALLFTDIEGSTRLVRQLGARWADVLRRHHEIVGGAIAAEGGWVDGVEGDAFFATFTTANAAARAAAAAQRRLRAEPWPPDVGQLRVRMGLHVGTLERVSTGYVGLEIHRAARVAAAAHGGQVLLTDAARRQIAEQLPADDLGWHRLRDFPTPEHLFCAVIDGQGAAAFPPPRTLGPPRQNLPAALDSFVGREWDLVDVTKLLQAHRLVTLVGPGGSGKTRLAVEVAKAQARTSADGPFFVDASPITDVALLDERVASGLGVRPPPGQSAAEALPDALAGRELLVVLDNLEQLAGANTAVSDLLVKAPGLRLLATSREPLHAPGEQLFPVGPLAVAEPSVDPTTPEALGTSATLLFVDRATAVEPSFVLTAQNAPAVVKICRELDGLPLAIELAVGWLRVLPPDLLLQQLDHRLELLREPGGARPDRQKTLRATIDWSYRLLDEPSARAFRALSVFVGGWTVTAAKVVCDCADDTAALHVLSRLADNSLIESVRTVGADPRFRMLETLREYGLAELAHRDEESAVRARLADYVGLLAAEGGLALTGPDQLRFLDRLDGDRDNINSALWWLLETGQPVLGLSIAAELWRHWRVRAYLEEGRTLLEELIAAFPADGPDDIRADGLIALGNLAYWQLDYGYAERCYGEALWLYDRAGDARGAAEAHFDLGYTSQIRGDSRSARASFALAQRGFSALDDELGVANTQVGFGFVAFATGAVDHASEVVADGLATLRRLGDTYDANNALSLLGAIRRLQGRFDDAGVTLRDALAVHDMLGNTPGIIWMLSELAAVAIETDRPVLALRLAGAAHALQGGQHEGVPLQVLELPDVRAKAVQMLGSQAAGEAWRSGQEMSHTDAIELALSVSADVAS